MARHAPLQRCTHVALTRVHRLNGGRPLVVRLVALAVLQLEGAAVLLQGRENLQATQAWRDLMRLP